MTKNLFLTTAIVTASFVANSALAETITERIEVATGETRTFDDAVAANISSGDNEGGVIYSEGTVTIGGTLSSFTNNSVSDDGGVIYNEKGKITISNSLFEENTATGTAVSAGGAIFNNALMDEKRNPAAIIEISNSGLNYNEASFGGAIYNHGKLDLSEVSFVENEATFTDRNNGGGGGAIYNNWLATINGGLFKYNNSFEGGAIFNRDTATISSASFTENNAYLGGAIYNERKMTILDSTFTGNTAIEDDSESDLPSGRGGAIYNYGKMTIANTTFANNSADEYYSYGGAIHNSKYGEMVISDSEFSGNEAKDGDGYGSGHGGAISNGTVSTNIGGTITISDTTFTGNKTHGTNGSPDAGGAIFNHAGTIKITNAIFTNNETVGSATGSGGAIYNEGLPTVDGVMEISKSSFSGNRSSFGGAINNDDILTLTDVTFDGNQAHRDYATEEYGGIGGAIYNNYFGKTTIINGLFTNNSSVGNGGAIYNRGEISFSDNNVFEGNTANNVKNDIYNDGTINVTGGLSLDGGIINSGTINFSDSSLKATLVDTGDTTTKIIAGADATHLGKLTGSLSLVLTDDDINKKIVLEGDKTGFNLSNTLYNINFNEVDTYTVVGKKDAEQIAESTGANANQAGTVAAIFSDTSASGNVTFDTVASNINEMLQSGDASQVQAALDGATAMSPDSAPTVQQTQSETTHQVFNAVGTRLSDGVSGNSRGMSSGDASENVSVWMQGLANHTKLDKTSKSYGFKADTYGVALGLEKKINSSVKAGISYAYSSTDADTKGRDTEVKTHTVLAYGEYKPSNWFVNGIVSYGWSDYKEDKDAAGTIVKAKYDVKTLGMQAVVGYDLYTRYATVTPLTGLRYVHIDSDNYVDSAGQKIASSDSNILTGIIGSKISKTFEDETGIKFTPEARVAMTYDLKQAHNKSNVVLPNGSSYSINGESLERFGVEVGGNLTAEVNDNVEMSLGYEGSFRKDYQNHNVLLNLKYNF